MTEERLRYIRNLHNLAPLHAHTDILDVDQNGKVVLNNKLAAPIDEFGMPRPEIMIGRLLGQMKTANYVWTGDFDEHHLATPKADYTVVRFKDEGDVGSAFRGLSFLKVNLPRQMHNFSHFIFELPRRPSIEVMRQAVYEVGEAKRLKAIIDEHLPLSPHAITRRVNSLCLDALSRKIERMREPELNLLPGREVLSGMNIEEVKKVLAALLKVRRFSKTHLIHPAIRKHQPSSIDNVSAAA